MTKLTYITYILILAPFQYKCTNRILFIISMDQCSTTNILTSGNSNVSNAICIEKKHFPNTRAQVRLLQILCLVALRSVVFGGTSLIRSKGSPPRHLSRCHTLTADTGIACLNARHAIFNATFL